MRYHRWSHEAPGRGAPYPVDDKTALRFLSMAWTVLVVSGMFEAVWATALGKSDGLTRIGPTIVFFAALLVSMSGLAYAMRFLPIGTSYAIWVGIGAVLTIFYSIMVDGEPISALKGLFLLGIVGSVIGLKLVA
jgi:quaternary ammonium compound-resistance protein SugE